MSPPAFEHIAPDNSWCLSRAASYAAQPEQQYVLASSMWEKQLVCFQTSLLHQIATVLDTKGCMIPCVSHTHMFLISFPLSVFGCTTLQRCLVIPHPHAMPLHDHTLGNLQNCCWVRRSATLLALTVPLICTTHFGVALSCKYIPSAFEEY